MKVAFLFASVVIPVAKDIQRMVEEARMSAGDTMLVWRNLQDSAIENAATAANLVLEYCDLDCIYDADSAVVFDDLCSGADNVCYQLEKRQLKYHTLKASEKHHKHTANIMLARSRVEADLRVNPVLECNDFTVGATLMSQQGLKAKALKTADIIDGKPVLAVVNPSHYENAKPTKEQRDRYRRQKQYNADIAYFAANGLEGYFEYEIADLINPLTGEPNGSVHLQHCE